MVSQVFKSSQDERSENELKKVSRNLEMMSL